MSCENMHSGTYHYEPAGQVTVDAPQAAPNPSWNPMWDRIQHPWDNDSLLGVDEHRYVMGYPLVISHNYGKSPFLLGKLPIDELFSLAMFVYQRVYPMIKTQPCWCEQNIVQGAPTVLRSGSGWHQGLWRLHAGRGQRVAFLKIWKWRIDRLTTRKLPLNGETMWNMATHGFGQCPDDLGVGRFQSSNLGCGRFHWRWNKNEMVIQENESPCYCSCDWDRFPQRKRERERLEKQSQHWRHAMLGREMFRTV